MESFSEGRVSDSPYIEMIWRGRAGSNYNPTCPADVRWNLLMLRYQGQVKVTVEGPVTQAVSKTQPEGMEWLVIKFKLGMFMPNLPVQALTNGDALMPEASTKSFWMHGTSWQLPTFENVENFVDKLMREQVIMRDPIVNAVIAAQPLDLSVRTLRRRFINATGLPHKTIQQIERAKQAMTLLQQGTSILDAAYQLGYADQAHMTRSLRHFIGQTPAQIVRSPVAS
jgi:AraC-like DNA-binding protein